MPAHTSQPNRVDQTPLLTNPNVNKLSNNLEKDHVNRGMEETVKRILWLRREILGQVEDAGWHTATPLRVCFRVGCVGTAGALVSKRHRCVTMEVALGLLAAAPVLGSWEPIPAFWGPIPVQWRHYLGSGSVLFSSNFCRAGTLCDQTLGPLDSQIVRKKNHWSSLFLLCFSQLQSLDYLLHAYNCSYLIFSAQLTSMWSLDL